MNKPSTELLDLVLPIVNKIKLLTLVTQHHPVGGNDMNLQTQLLLEMIEDYATQLEQACESFLQEQVRAHHDS